MRLQNVTYVGKTSIILSQRREVMSIREIARRNDMSRKTVRKDLRVLEKIWERTK